MKRKLQNITSKAYSVAAIVVLLFVWQILSSAGIVPSFLLPSPLEVVQAFVKDFPLLMEHAKVTLTEGFFRSDFGSGNRVCCCSFNGSFSRILQSVLSDYGDHTNDTDDCDRSASCTVDGIRDGAESNFDCDCDFFPIAIGLLEGFQSADKDTVNLLKAMGANRLQNFFTVKFPSSLGRIFCKSSDFGVLLCGRGCNLRVAWRI